MGRSLFAQRGGKSDDAKAMHGDLRGVVEIIADERGTIFRGMYYVGKERIYVLHFFQKKSKRGIATPKKELDLIRKRLAWSRHDEKESR